MQTKFKKLINRPRLILDVKGLLMNSWFSGEDPDSFAVPGKDKRTNTAGYAIQVLLNKFLLPAMNNTFAPIDVIAVWDGGNIYRKGLFPSYKQKRSEEKEETPARIKQELELMENVCKRLLAQMGVVNMVVDGVEGDDVIAMLCERLDCYKVVYTIDSDLLQVSSEKTTVFLREEAMTDGYHEGVLYRHLALRKSIVGDASDEYPGIKGMGPKAFEAIYEAYGEDGADELIQIVENKDWETLAQAATCKNLLTVYENRETWRTQYLLAKQHPHLCWGFRGSKKIEPVYYTRAPNRQACFDLLNRVGIPHLIADLEPFFGIEALMVNDNRDKLWSHFKNELALSPIVAFDYETYDTLQHAGFIEALSPQARSRGYVDVLSQAICGASLMYGMNLQHCVYIPAEHKDTDKLIDVIKAALELIIEVDKPVAAHNASFEEQVTKQCLDLDFNGMIDTAVTQSYIAEEEEVGLKDLTKTQLGMVQTTYQDLLAAHDAADMRDITGEQVLRYGLDDSIGGAHLWKLHDLIMQVERSAQFYYRNETVVTHVLNRSFEAGIRIDFQQMDKLAAEDAELVIAGREKIIATLSEHCTEEKPDAAEAYFEADYDYHRTVYRATAEEKGWSRDKVKAEMEVLKLKYADATVYHPVTEVWPVFDVTGTPGEFNKVAEHLGLPKLEALTSPKVTSWLMSLGEYPLETGAELRALVGPAMKGLNKYRILLKQAADNVELRDEIMAGAKVAYPQPAALVGYLQHVLQSTAKPSIEGDELNFGSPKQMQELLYLKLGLPVRERTFPKRVSFRGINGLPGSPATNDEAVEAAKLYDCPEGDWRREFLGTFTKVKEADTRESLYYRPYPHWVHPRDGVIHPGIINCGTATRRPTGTSPNVLQVSKGPVRTCFMPRYDGHCIITADFNGQELRITANESQDPVMIEAYIGGGTYIDQYGRVRANMRDIHSVTACSFVQRVVRNKVSAAAAELLLLDASGFVNYEFYLAVRKAKGEIPALGTLTTAIQDACKLARDMAKVVNFLIIYGGNYRTLAKKLGVPEDFAKVLMDNVFLSYARLAPWQKEVIQQAIEVGYITTAHGTWKHISQDLKSKDGGLRSRAERQTVNHKIQGGAADILKEVLREAHETELFEQTRSVMLAPVYDEIAASVPIANAVEYCDRLQACMNICAPGHKVPMLAEISIGRNWGSVEELKDNPAPEVIEAAIERAFAA